MVKWSLFRFQAYLPKVPIKVKLSGAPKLLDGGRVLSETVELVPGKPLSEKDPYFHLVSHSIGDKGFASHSPRHECWNV